MILALFLLGLAIISKGFYDFNSAVYEITTFSSVINKSIDFEIGYYIFGLCYGFACQASNNDILKLFSGIVGGMCLLISGYVIFDTYNETYFSAGKCAVGTSDLDKINQCLKRLL